MEPGVECNKFRIFLVDDHPIVLTGLSQVINKQQDMICCGTAGCVSSARRSFSAYFPDLITVDLGLPDGDGVQLIKDFTLECPSVPILVVSQCDETIYAERALRAGARGYVMKERCIEDVVSAIRAILSGELFVSQKVAALALRQMVGKKGNSGNGSLNSLSDRELEVLQLLGAGLSTRATSVKLNLSIKTIETHRENIKHKLGIPDAAGLIHFATTWVDRQSHRPPGSRE
jgi:DNA-binding NarL/FixJ family response regulator